MPTLGGKHASVLRQYARPIVHLRKQVSQRRFGFIFGSGLSDHFGIPTWSALVDALAHDRHVRGVGLLKVPLPHAGEPYRTEMLFEHYRKRRYRNTVPTRHNRELDNKIASDWRELVRTHLYAKAPDNFRGELTKHPYLKACLPLIRQSHMTVTYNFDDFIEQAIFVTSSSEDRQRSRGYECVTNPWVQFRRSNSIIYHPNGVIPQRAMETPSDRLVFSESSFAEQMMGIFAGGHAGLLSHLSKNTCLLIGLSLEDETLRSLLAQSAQSSPGNYHYYVHFLKPNKTLDCDKQYAIRAANFKVYNLITLFLHGAEIRALTDLINIESCPSNSFRDFAEAKGTNVCFRYYLTGPMGVGKSTTLNNFRSLSALDEWLEQRPDVLAKPPETLSDEERRVADRWIARQFKLKNDILKDDGEGVFMLDRGPIDPLAFTEPKNWKKKAGRLLSALCPGNATWKVQDGRVILLQDDPKELAIRMLMTAREDYTAERLDKNQRMLSTAYGRDGVIPIDTRGLTTSDVTQRVAEIVHLEKYDPVCDLHSRLERIWKEGIDGAN